MFKKIRLVLTITGIALLLFSCLKKTSKKEVEDNLKAAMDQYLNHQPRLDTSKVKFNVLDVSYYEDKMTYICEFKVNMSRKINDQIKDTSGIMAANVSKDFKTVGRKY
jgi:PBP1b-binding outer membrane lipoprotein LpoB